MCTIFFMAVLHIKTNQARIFSCYLRFCRIFFIAHSLFAKKSVALDQHAQSGAPCRNFGFLNLTTFAKHVRCELFNKLIGLDLRTLSTDVMDMIPSLSASISDRPLGPSKTDRRSACLDKSCDVNHFGSGLTHDLEIFLERAWTTMCAPFFRGCTS